VDGRWPWWARVSLQEHGERRGRGGAGVREGAGRTGDGSDEAHMLTCFFTLGCTWEAGPRSCV
jgi:hypothetical protein